MFWTIITDNLCAVRGTTIEEHTIGTLNKLRSEFVDWAQAENRAKRRQTTPANLTPMMLGKQGTESRFGGAEANSVLAWAVTSLIPGLGAVGETWANLRTCGDALNRAVTVFREHKSRPNVAVCQDCR